MFFMIIIINVIIKAGANIISTMPGNMNSICNINNINQNIMIMNNYDNNMNRNINIIHVIIIQTINNHI